MTALSEYQEPIKLAGKSLGDKYQGYKIDGNSPNPDMRKDAGLGTCNSCDYLISNPTTSILVEETQLALQIRNLKREYHYLDEDQQTEFLIKHIRNEMRLKVYGSMLVLCRLSASRTESKAFLHGRKYKFWLVASGEPEAEDMRALDNLRDGLFKDLRSVLTREVVEGVEIMLRKDFQEKYSRTQV